MWKRAASNSCARCDLAFDREATESKRRLVERPRRRPSPAPPPAATPAPASAQAPPAATAAAPKRKLEPQQSLLSENFSVSASDQCSPAKQSVLSLSELDSKPSSAAIKREPTAASVAPAAPDEQQRRLRSQPTAEAEQMRSRTTLLGSPGSVQGPGSAAPSQSNGLQRSAGSAFDAVGVNSSSNPQELLQQIIATASRAAALANQPPAAQSQFPPLPLPFPIPQQQQPLPNNAPLMMQFLQRMGLAGSPGAAAALLNGPKPPPLAPALSNPFLGLPGVGVAPGFPGLPPNPAALHNLPISMALPFAGFAAPGLPGMRPSGSSLPGLPLQFDPGAALMHSLLSPLLAATGNGVLPPLPNPMSNPLAAAAQLQLLSALAQSQSQPPSPLVSPLHQSLGGQMGAPNNLNHLNNIGALLLAASAMAAAPPPHAGAQLPAATAPPLPAAPPVAPPQRAPPPPPAFLHSSTSAFTSANNQITRLSNSSPQQLQNPAAPLFAERAHPNVNSTQSAATASATLGASLGNSTQSAMEAAVQNILQTLSKSSLVPPPATSAAPGAGVLPLVPLSLPGGLKLTPELLDSLK